MSSFLQTKENTKHKNKFLFLPVPKEGIIRIIVILLYILIAFSVLRFLWPLVLGGLAVYFILKFVKEQKIKIVSVCLVVLISLIGGGLWLNKVNRDSEIHKAERVVADAQKAEQKQKDDAEKAKQDAVAKEAKVEADARQAEKAKQSDIEKITSIGDGYETTVWGEDGNFAKEGVVPYEVIINTSPNQLDCFGSKNALFELNKKIYTDAQLKGKISRVLFSSWGILRSSFGSSDAGIDWTISGPSNFWRVILQVQPTENETGAMANRTWGVSLNGCK